MELCHSLWSYGARGDILHFTLYNRLVGNAIIEGRVLIVWWSINIGPAAGGGGV